MPNAGMPENEGGKAVYKMTSKDMTDVMCQFLKKYKNIRMVGGCCGTTPTHISELSKAMARYPQ
jgi:5-methyltetrahydrofolate--homocysteine methyltransferase